MPASHHIKPTIPNVRWGAFDASFAAVKEVDPGDLVILECVSGAKEVMPPAGSGLAIPEKLAAIQAGGVPRLGPHILTGPVAVKGAEPGDVLRVDIEKIELGAEWGFCAFRPLVGTLHGTHGH